MSRYNVEGFICALRMTPARRATAIERMTEHVDALPPEKRARLTPFVESAMRRQHQALAMEEEWRVAEDKVAIHADGAKKADSRIDKTLSMFVRTLDWIMETGEPEDAALASKLRTDLFADGVAPITNLPFVEQHMSLRSIAGKLRGDKYRDIIETLKIGHIVDRMEILNAEYGRRLSRPERLSYDSVREADTDGFVGLVEMLAVVLGLYPTNSPEDIEGRRNLLQPLVEQQEQSSLLTRSRRRNSPEEGKEEDSDEEDSDEEDSDEEGSDEEDSDEEDSDEEDSDEEDPDEGPPET